MILLGLIAAAAATDAAIQEKIRSSRTTILVISNGEMGDIMKTVKSPEKSGLWIKSVSQTIKNKENWQKSAFLSMLLATLDTSLLGNLLAGKVIVTIEGRARAGQDF